MNTKAKSKPVKKTEEVNKISASGANKNGFFFTKENYILTLVSVVVLIIGFALMSGSEGDIYDTRRTTIAPIVVMIGFAIGGIAILYKPKAKS
jgi:uncharacterized membrane protein